MWICRLQHQHQQQSTQQLIRSLALFSTTSVANNKSNSRTTTTTTTTGGGKVPQMTLDPTQLRLLDSDQCILVDEQDNVIGSASKRNCHLMANIDKGMLHRAFSVFLFDSSGKRLLLQQRSAQKITYPNHWTNTCCSHPLFVSDEMDDVSTNLQNDGDGPFLGIKRAARRRLNYELGISESALPLSMFHLIARIQYKAENVPHDGIFGEHEIDYVLFVKDNDDTEGVNSNVQLAPNSNEVQSVKYVNVNELKDLLAQSTQTSQQQEQQLLITPWFKFIADTFLYDWWSKLPNMLDIKTNLRTIHRF